MLTAQDANNIAYKVTHGTNDKERKKQKCLQFVEDIIHKNAELGRNDCRLCFSDIDDDNYTDIINEIIVILEQNGYSITEKNINNIQCYIISWAEPKFLWSYV